MKITAIIVVHGNPSHFSQCVESIVNHVDEIIIGDVGMSVHLPQKAKAKSKIIKLDQKTPFADLVKEDLKAQATGDFILYLDPDEVLNESFWNIVKKEVDNYDYFLLPRKNIIFGKWISRAGWWPDYQVRFFRKDAVVWPKKIHPQPTTTGREYKIEAKEELAILHFNYDNITHYLEKAIRYAKFEADDAIREHKELTLRQTIPHAIHEFISRYFANDGYKDGSHGFIVSFLQMFYYFLVFFFYVEKRNYTYREEASIPKEIAFFFRNSYFESNYWLIKKKLLSPWQTMTAKVKNIILKM